MTRPKKSKWFVVGGVFAAILVVAAAAIFIHKNSSSGAPGATQQALKLTTVKEVSQAGFPYLVPKNDAAWQFNATSPVFDESKGVVTYTVKLTDSNSTVKLSQQKLPDELKPVPTSAKFNQFIVASNVTFSEPVGLGKAYFREALQNGVPANGATTVIFATNDVLLFGQVGQIMGYDKWAKLLASMQLTGGQ